MSNDQIAAAAVAAYRGSHRATLPQAPQPASDDVLADVYGELQALRNHVEHWRRSGLDDSALRRADEALAARRTAQAPAPAYVLPGGFVPVALAEARLLSERLREEGWRMGAAIVDALCDEVQVARDTRAPAVAPDDARDAARYRWLKSLPGASPNLRGMAIAGARTLKNSFRTPHAVYVAESIDGAIDAAMGTAKPPVPGSGQ